MYSVEEVAVSTANGGEWDGKLVETASKTVGMLRDLHVVLKKGDACAATPRKDWEDKPEFSEDVFRTQDDEDVEDACGDLPPLLPEHTALQCTVCGARVGMWSMFEGCAAKAFSKAALAEKRAPLYQNDKISFSMNHQVAMNMTTTIAGGMLQPMCLVWQVNLLVHLENHHQELSSMERLQRNRNVQETAIRGRY
eukprot:jgi/Picre1/28634/NNA_004034.t1